jgi:hypothetical protein
MHRTGREAQGLEARAMENLVAMDVVGSLFEIFVMWAVDFDDEPSAQADEVGIVAQQRRLPAEVEAIRSQDAKPHP